VVAPLGPHQQDARRGDDQPDEPRQRAFGLQPNRQQADQPLHCQRAVDQHNDAQREQVAYRPRLTRHRRPHAPTPQHPRRRRERDHQRDDEDKQRCRDTRGAGGAVHRRAGQALGRGMVVAYI